MTLGVLATENSPRRGHGTLRCKYQQRFCLKQGSRIFHTLLLAKVCIKGRGIQSFSGARLSIAGRHHLPASVDCAPICPLLFPSSFETVKLIFFYCTFFGVCVHARLCVLMCVCMYICVCTLVCMYVCVVCKHRHACLHPCICTHVKVKGQQFSSLLPKDQVSH